MRSAHVGILFPALLLLGPQPHRLLESSSAGSVTVTNFPDTQTVTGSVKIAEPAPSTRLLTMHAVVTPAAPTDIASLTEGGVIDATGFVSATLSLNVAMQGSVPSQGKVGALLVPDLPEIQAAMHNQNVVEFPIAVEAHVVPSATGLHASTPVPHRLGFPRYRVFFYNTTARTADTILYTYLSNS
jgi:hypothetical protein